MNEIDFRKWLLLNKTNKKVQSDLISRIKRVEKNIGHCDIDVEYHNDQCKILLSYFNKNGCNDLMNNLSNCDLPIGKYNMSTFRHAIKKYIQFKNDNN